MTCTISNTVIVVFFDRSSDTPNAMYGITVKCSDDTKMTDNPVYGAK